MVYQNLEKNKKGKVNFFIICLASLFALISFVNATGPSIVITVTNQTISASGFLFYEGYGKYPAPIITSFNESIPTAYVCRNITSTQVVNGTNHTTIINTTCSVKSTYSKEIPVVFSNQSLVLTDSSSKTEYQNCVFKSAQYEAGLNVCSAALNSQVAFKDNYTQCSTNLQICNSEKSICSTDLSETKKEYTDNQNAKYYWGAIGIILGIVGLMFYRQEIGGPKIKDPKDNFNVHGSG